MDFLTLVVSHRPGFGWAAPRKQQHEPKVLTSQGLWVTQNPVQSLSGNLLKGLIGWGQECELAVTLQQGIES